jgi:hypothetical protein
MMKTRLQKPKLGTKAKTPNPRKSADGLEEGITDTYCDGKQRKKGKDGNSRSRREGERKGQRQRE